MKKTIGNRIRKIRKTKGITQEEISDLLGISQSTYQRIESGETYSWATHLEKLSKILEFKPEDFFSDKPIEYYEKRIEELEERIEELERKK